jgi:hypothetical protein
VRKGLKEKEMRFALLQQSASTHKERDKKERKKSASLAALGKQE